ncbi:S-layer homology domain-containing protein [Bacillus sp. FJAT-26390]|uniref:S-layer homology domain-containing protein n=1 Tax=Bacillus sp. FJAT-26390 TaxID=1743142 RepID=UPI000807B775|nr:S-layer homology domain-containing protein [Bacillus sp. FJAT-26390]OBZ16124.1 hypothetical protein A7975_30230 [Bacillus sp. FJAT-26390]
MRRKLTSVLLGIILAVVSIPTIAMGDNAPSFSLSLPTTAVSTNQDVRVTVKGEQLVDLYGYELRLQYDNTRLRFKSAAAHWTGLSVPASDKDGVITFAHTKLGKASGESGTAQIATLSFETIAAGPATFKLERVKLVDSKVAAATLTPNVQAKINISSNNQPILFVDLAGHWAEANVKLAVELGFINGYPDATFRPNAQVTRAEFTAMLARAVPLPAGAVGEVALDFADISVFPDWAKPYIAEAAAAGIISGYEDRTFRPGGKINRAEMAVMIARAAGFDLTLNQTSTFSDEAQIPSWAKTAVTVSVDKALLNGRGNNRFVPLGDATRAEALTVILKLRDLR